MKKSANNIGPAAEPNRSVQKYLSQQAEPEARLCLELAGSLANKNASRAQLNKKGSSDWFDREQALIIPACNEKAAFVANLAKHSQAATSLLILVVNDNELSNRETQENNQKLIDELMQRANSIGRLKQLHALELGELKILLITRCLNLALPAKQGVGLARKIAADCACALIDSAFIKRPIIFSTDADARLPNNYFSLDEGKHSASAWTFDFTHRGGDNAVQHATELYERSLKAWPRELKRAGSPYAYQSLGSCLAFDYRAYAQVRGFPKRAAAEDFYLLNKLAKINGVSVCPEICIELQARRSSRVPFGTGPAVARLIEQQQRGEQACWYDPAIFSELAEVLKRVDTFQHHYQQAAAELKPCTRAAIEAAGIEAFIHKRQQQGDSREQFLRHFHQWFDAFQSLKFIRHLQQHAYPPKAIEEVC
ncbi:hypothetical protein [Agaribacterium haliotis]|uniref:hypothetical protein n=1 Tax=Agaribacterium haliotis TaxID=2013869 RepID=UPI000BB56DD3|nr:hypothetical protein [Agaribacterium haliotis]